MTIPNLMTSIQEKQTVSKLRATQAILAQALKSVEEDEGEPTGWGLAWDKSESDAKIIAQKLLKNIKVAVDCGTNDTKKFCVTDKSYNFLSGESDVVHYASGRVYYKVKLQNGTSIWWRSGSEIVFFVDVNDVKLPNTWGKDLFGFIYLKSGVGGLRPLGSDDCNMHGRGLGCAFHVLQTGSMSYLHKK